MAVRVADARRSLVYIGLMDSSDVPQLLQIEEFVLGLDKTDCTLAVIHSSHGWILSKAAQNNPEIFKAGLFVGTNVFHLRCVGIRCGTGVSSIRGLFSMSNAVLYWYPRSEPNNYRTMTLTGDCRKYPLTASGRECGFRSLSRWKLNQITFFHDVGSLFAGRRCRSIFAF